MTTFQITVKPGTPFELPLDNEFAHISQLSLIPEEGKEEGKFRSRFFCATTTCPRVLLGVLEFPSHQVVLSDIFLYEEEEPVFEVEGNCAILVSGEIQEFPLSSDSEEEEDDDDAEEEEEKEVVVEKKEEKKEVVVEKKEKVAKEAAPVQEKAKEPMKVEKKASKPEMKKREKEDVREQSKKEDKESKKPLRRVLKGGLVIHEMKEGTGKPAIGGRKVSVRYVGKLDNGRVFDSNTGKRAAPFTFRLGAGEVIRGWDMGVIGMKEGGKRRLEVPPKLAYGNADMGVIPKNSRLTFDVELIKVQ